MLGEDAKRPIITSVRSAKGKLVMKARWTIKRLEKEQKRGGLSDGSASSRVDEGSGMGRGGGRRDY